MGGGGQGLRSKRVLLEREKRTIWGSREESSRSLGSPRRPFPRRILPQLANLARTKPTQDIGVMDSWFLAQIARPVALRTRGMEGEQEARRRRSRGVPAGAPRLTLFGQRSAAAPPRLELIDIGVLGRVP